jgi:hypothetical protein
MKQFLVLKISTKLKSSTPWLWCQLLFAVTCNSKEPSTESTILLAVCSSPVSLSSLNTVLWLTGTGTVSAIDGAREKSVELTSLCVTGRESESMSADQYPSRTPDSTSYEFLKRCQMISHAGIQYFGHCVCLCLQELRHSDPLSLSVCLRYLLAMAGQ